MPIRYTASVNQRRAESNPVAMPQSPCHVKVVGHDSVEDLGTQRDSKGFLASVGDIRRDL